MKYYSITCSTKNEDNKLEVSLEHHKGLFSTLFNRPRKVETYVSYVGINWFKKDTMEAIFGEKNSEIAEIYYRLMVAQK